MEVRESYDVKEPAKMLVLTTDFGEFRVKENKLPTLKEKWEKTRDGLNVSLDAHVRNDIVQRLRPHPASLEKGEFSIEAEPFSESVKAIRDHLFAMLKFDSKSAQTVLTDTAYDKETKLTI